jgi:hypothetical protein
MLMKTDKLREVLKIVVYFAGPVNRGEKERHERGKEKKTEKPEGEEKRVKKGE